MQNRSTDLPSRQTETPPLASKSHVPFLDYFRAFAILFVVLIHSGNAVLLRGISDGGAETASGVRTVVHILSHNSTVYFALISGVLYAFTLHRKPHLPFLKSRVLNVFVPYAVISIGLTVLLYGYASYTGRAAFDPLGLARLTAYNVALGEAWNTLWYIPVVMVLYIISPPLLAIVRTPSWQWLAVAIALVPLFVSRTGSEVTPAMIAFFIGVYVVGLAIGADLDRALTVFRKSRGVLWIAVVCSATAVAFLDARGIEFLGQTSLRESAIYILRLAISGLVLLWLYEHCESFGTRTSALLLLFANYAFGIYFLHGPLLRPIARVLGEAVPVGDPWLAVSIAICAAFVLALTISTVIVHVIVRTTSPFSRYLIGAVAAKPAKATGRNSRTDSTDVAAQPPLQQRS
ncbi:acyltransferase [Qipengyuania sp. 6B39]|uniref:acyltransferase n=1 Tax=Qipengyuania proteolytica TaxID=2867239 RepID=UPI001C8A8B76|nr:acyltransferase [Qipengyuania proteolytica]MBX7495793.1 acyltransferase [Qipengyuania proteolytica]